MAEKMEEYKVQELCDDALETGQWNEYMKSRYVYEFKQGNRTIRGLTSEAICHIALQHGISIESTKCETMETGVLYTAVAVRTERIHTEDEHDTPTYAGGASATSHRFFRAEGVCFEPFNTYTGEFDKFCWQKALTKACRNARKQLIPATMQIAAIDALMNLEKPPHSETLSQSVAPQEQRELPTLHDTTPKATQPNGGAAPTSERGQHWEDKRALARKRAFAFFAEKKDKLAEMGIDTETFWQGVREKYNVTSRKDMSLNDWIDVINSLKTPQFAKWITVLNGKNR